MSIFKPMDKMARLVRPCVITEKIDGTNASVIIVNVMELPACQAPTQMLATSGLLAMFAGSRTRLVTPESDNFGWAAWVKANAEDLWALGKGQHFGEWWGGKIQRGYGVKERRFSLFNVARWDSQSTPSCCHVVPTLYRGDFTTTAVEEAIDSLRQYGSVAAPGFFQPEGVVIYHEHSGKSFKQTLENDATGKTPKGFGIRVKGEAA